MCLQEETLKDNESTPISVAAPVGAQGENSSVHPGLKEPSLARQQSTIIVGGSSPPLVAVDEPLLLPPEPSNLSDEAIAAPSAGNTTPEHLQAEEVDEDDGSGDEPLQSIRRTFSGWSIFHTFIAFQVHLVEDSRPSLRPVSTPGATSIVTMSADRRGTRVEHPRQGSNNGG